MWLGPVSAAGCYRAGYRFRVAAAKRAAADRELRTMLLRACNGNYALSLEVDDLAPIREC
jgi:hypothetical protein